MENATKALLIAGGVLVAIIIVSLGLYLYILFSNQADTYKATIQNTELQKFNSKFEGYIDRDDLTAFDVITAKNMAAEYNNTNLAITIEVNSSLITATNEEFLKNNSEKVFKCGFEDVHYNSDTRRIDGLNFKTVSSPP